jgi:hypothetical protein
MKSAPIGAFFFIFKKNKKMARPALTDFPPYFERYISLVPEEDILQVMAASMQELKLHLSAVSNEKAAFAYEPGKWTVKQLLQHVIDAERIFAYRALSIARGEQQSLLSFDENAYADNADASGRHLKDIKEEMMTVRQSSVYLFQSFTPEMLSRKGLSGNNPVTTLALGYILIGHWRHHAGIIKSRYGISL